MISAVLLDLDGVIVDSKAAWHATLNAIRRAHGLPDIGEAEFETCWGQSVADDARRFFAGVYTGEELSRRYDEEFCRRASDARPIDGIGALLDHLLARRVPFAVATNATRATAGRLLDGAGLRKRLPIVVTADDVPRPKPAPDVLLEACRRLGAEPSRAVLVGDTEIDLRAAGAAGVLAIGYRMGGAPHRIDRLDELPALLNALAAR
jgi:HAD superfamily hydrolase (TIGR01509 family)